MNEPRVVPSHSALTRSRRALRDGLAISALLVGALLGSARAQAPSPAPTAVPQADINDKLKAIAAELADARTRATAGTGDQKAALDNDVTLLERIDWFVDQQGQAQQRGADLQRDQTRTAQELQALKANGLESKPPYDIATLDNVRDQLLDARQRAKDQDLRVWGADESLAQAKTNLDEAESARRQAKEALDTNTDAAQTQALEQALRVRQLESRAAAEWAALCELQAADEHLDRQVQQNAIDALTERVARMTPQTRFTSDALKEQLVRLDKEGSDISQTLESAKLEQPALDRNWSTARRKLDNTPGADAALADEVEARRQAQQTGQLAVTVAGNRLERNRARKEIWNRRFAVADGADSEQRATWENDVRQALDQNEREQRLEQSRLDETRDGIAAAEKAANAAPDSRPLRDQQRRLVERARLYDADLADLNATRLLALKLQDELRAQRESLPFKDRLADTWQAIQSAWRYELTSVDDRPVTVGKIVLGLVLVTLGLWVSRLVSRQLGQRIFPRMGLNPGAAAALQSLTFYVLVCLLTLLALRLINIPLTVFTILGGALAIGVGFGSQNVVNNFISGLILLAERPIKIGDLVEIDGTAGSVQHIGPRSTRLRSPNNTDVIVPNSAFLEKKLINWAPSDENAHLQVKIAVAYGSTTHDVARLLRQAVDDHARVLRYPEPIVLFADFGDSGLVFEVHFWVHARNILDGRVVESDIRYRIEELLRAEHIALARAPRVDAPRPVEMRAVEKS